MLREFGDGLRIVCPTEILEWGTENETLNTWSRKSKLDIDDTGLTPSCSAFSLSPAYSSNFVDSTFMGEAGGRNAHK